MFKYKNTSSHNLVLTLERKVLTIKPFEEFEHNQIINNKFIVDISPKIHIEQKKDIKKQNTKGNLNDS